jgi:hypothetical protein
MRCGGTPPLSTGRYGGLCGEAFDSDRWHTRPQDRHEAHRIKLPRHSRSGGMVVKMTGPSAFRKLLRHTLPLSLQS